MADTKETNTTVENNTTTESNSSTETNTTDSNTTSNTETTTTTPSGEPITIDKTIKLYIATFGRVGDANGLKYWANIKNDTGKVSGFTKMEQIASSFFDQPETKALYEGKSNEDLIKAIYKNVLGREGEQSGIDYWVGELNKGHFTRGEAILAIINGTKGTDATLLNNKLEVGKAYYDAGLNDAEFARTVIKDVTADPKSVDAAKLLIDHYGKLYLTAGTDILNGTMHDDTVLETNAKDDLKDVDKIVDPSTDDNDTMTATVSSDKLHPIIQNIENIKIIGEYISTGLDLKNVTGTKVLTLDTKIPDGTAKVLNESVYRATSIVAGENISELKVYSVDTGTKGNVNIDAGNADVILSGDKRTDKYTVSLANDKKITLSGDIDTSDDAVVINAKGDFRIVNDNGADDLSLTINNVSSSPIRVKALERGKNLAKELTLSGNDILIDVECACILGKNLTKFTSTATKSTIEILSSADDVTTTLYDYHRLNVTEVSIFKNLGLDKNITVNGASTVNLSVKDANTTIAFDSQDDATILNLNITKDQKTFRMGNNIEQTVINVSPTSEDNTTASNKITIDTIDVNGSKAEKVIITTPDKNLVVNNLKVHAISTSDKVTQFEFISGMKTAGLTLKGVTSSINETIKIVGGAGNDTLVGSGKNDKINGGAGNDYIYGESGNDTIDGQAGNDHIYGRGGNDIIIAGDTSAEDSGSDFIFIGSSDDNDTIKYFTKGTDTLAVAGTARGKTDLSDLANTPSSTNPIQTKADKEVYKFVGSQAVTLKGIKETDLSDSIQLGSLSDGTPFTASGGDVIAGAKNDFIKAASNYKITLKGGEDAVAITTGDNNITVKDFKIGEDRVVLYNSSIGDINKSIDLRAVDTPKDGNYSFYNNDYNITLKDLTSTAGKDFVQLGYGGNYFTVDGNVTGGKFDDHIKLHAEKNETHVVNFINDGGFDSIKFDGNGTHHLSFNLMAKVEGKHYAITEKKGEKLDKKLSDAGSGHIYIIDNSDFSCKLDTAVKSSSYGSGSFTAEVAKCINSALGTTSTESYITIIEGANFDKSSNNQNDSLIYLTNGNDSGVQASDLTLIGIVLDQNITTDNISTYSSN